ncbi:MAG: hypothetical protein SGJ21_14925 [Alphaproteobacteria bacterium]|nr:hypothetical protein [Alphaproteobacteria bacterium]
MRQLIGLIIGLYLTVALVVAGGGAYGFLSGQTARDYDCTPVDLAITAGVGEGLEGSPNWVPWVLIRAAIWPKAYYDDRNKVSGVVDWLLVRYDPFPNACR